MSTEITPKALEGKLNLYSLDEGDLEIYVGSTFAGLTQAEVLDLIVVLLEWTSENMRRKLSGNSAGTTTKGQE